MIEKCKILIKSIITWENRKDALKDVLDAEDVTLETNRSTKEMKPPLYKNNINKT